MWGVAGVDAGDAVGVEYAAQERRAPAVFLGVDFSKERHKFSISSNCVNSDDSARQQHGTKEGIDGMIEAIKKIDNLGVFDQYKKESAIKPFGHLNLFYGMNGSGKTTLSRLFLALNEGESSHYSELKYQISTSPDSKIYKNGQKYPTKIRVFNSDYIEENIGQIEGKINPIYIIGKPQKDLIKEIEEHKAKLEISTGEKDANKKEKTTLTKNRDKEFTDIAKVIGSVSGQTTRQYRKPDAEKKFDDLKKSDDFKILTNEALEDYQNKVQQKLSDEITPPNLEKMNPGCDDAAREILLSDAITIIAQKVQEICSQKSDSLAIERLQKNPDIAEWVEKGIELHSTHKSETCEYCLQQLPENRIDAIAKHFNDSDHQLKGNIEAIITEIATLKENLDNLSYGSEHELYEDLRDDYKNKVASFENSKEQAISHLDEMKSILQEKLSKRTESYMPQIPNYDKRVIGKAIKECNEVIDKHNTRTKEFEAFKKDVQDAIEKHHLSSIKENIDDIDCQIEDLNDRLKILNDGDGVEPGINELNKLISEKQSKIANTKEAADELNKYLQFFLGHENLKCKIEEDGYAIMRDSIPASQLSEGEKTAIAFIYFLVQLKDRDFKMSEGIVVIDDPISSLDSNSIYQAFSFLKREVAEAKQVFLFTHNFDFLKLLIDWFKHEKEKESFYMLTKKESIASIKHLDKVLLENATEYAYLFKQLYNFKSDGTIGNCYHISNIARKVLETFLEFYYSGKGSYHDKLKCVKFDDNKKASLFKFFNDTSHKTGQNLNPALVSGTEENVKYLLEMIKEVSPTHYSSLEESISNTKD